MPSATLSALLPSEVWRGEEVVWTRVRGCNKAHETLHGEIDVPTLVVRDHPVHVTNAHAGHGEDDGVQVNDARRQVHEHGVAHSRHQEQEGHLAPPEAQEPEQYPERRRHQVTNSDAGAARV